MKDVWIAPESLFDGEKTVFGRAVRIVDGHVAEIADASNVAEGDVQRING